MDNDNALNVQNGFFNQARKDRTPVTILLGNGQRISGTVKSFDKFTLLLDTRHGEQIVFKHAIATVSALRPEEPRAKIEKKFGNFIDAADLGGKKEP